MTTPREDAREMVAGMLKTIAEQNDEVERLKTEIAQLGREQDAYVRAGTKLREERDKLKSAIDRHVSESVREMPYGRCRIPGHAEVFTDRPSAEAAYRELAFPGLGTDTKGG